MLFVGRGGGGGVAVGGEEVEDDVTGVSLSLLAFHSRTQTGLAVSWISEVGFLKW